MTNTYGCPGGAQKSGVTTAAAAIDLSAIVGSTVDIWSDDQDIWVAFTAAAETSTTIVTSGDLAASKTAIKGRRVARGQPIRRTLRVKYPRMLVQTVTGTALVHVAVVEEVRG